MQRNFPQSGSVFNRNQQPWGTLTEQAEKLKASVRAKVEHPFRVIKRQFGFTKTRYRGLAKNKAQVNMLVGLANLYLLRGRLMAA